MKILQYFVFLFGVFAFMYCLPYAIDTDEPSVLTDAGLVPDRLLANSKNYIHEHAYERSLQHLDLAITSMKGLEESLDSSSKAGIDQAIIGLETIYDEILADTLKLEDMNSAFVQALNALAFAEIRVMEQYVENHDHEHAIIALKYGMVHLRNALNFTSGEAHDYELHIYEEMDSLLDNENISDEDMIAKLELMLVELGDKKSD